MKPAIYDAIDKNLKTSFEKSLFKAACDLLDIDSPLRLNCFACSIRELSRHFLERLAPDEKVLSCVWFSPNDPEHPRKITRVQRVKYAIRGMMSDAFAQTIFVDDVIDNVCKKVKKAVDKLSKYTHVEEKTFSNSEADVVALRDEVLYAFLNFFDSIERGIAEMEEAFERPGVYDEIYTSFTNTINELDCLASHYNVQHVSIDNLKVLSVYSDAILYEFSGIISVRLQYGSDGDMIRGDGYETYMDFPYESKCTRKLVNKAIFYECDVDDIKVDTDSFYGDDIDAQIDKAMEEAMKNRNINKIETD